MAGTEANHPPPPRLVSAAPMASTPPPFDGPERRRAPFIVSFDLRSILITLGLLGPLVALITAVLQVRQDVRANSMRATAQEARISALEAKARESDNSVLLYCAGRRDMVDSLRKHVPDIGC